MINVKFYQGTFAQYSALSNKEEKAFYYITDKQELYLGTLKLSNAADLENAIKRVAQNETDISALQDAVILLNGDKDKTGSVANSIAALESTLNTKIESLEKALEEAGKVDDVKVNGVSVVGEDKVADIKLGTYYEVAAGATIETVVVEPKVGDVAVVIENITEDGAAASRTAYYYDGEKWIAMDGNVNAENVYFAKDLTTTSAIGNITLTNGQATIAAAGKNLKQVFDTIFVKEKNPTITQPSVSFTTQPSGSVEVGTQITANYAVNLNSGKYEYGPATNVTATAYAVSDTEGNSATTASGNFGTITIGDDTTYKITAKVTYSDGAIPLTNVGNEYATGQIKAGTKSVTSNGYTGYRKAFAGSKTEAVELTSANIRALTYNGNVSTTSFNLAILEGAKQVIIAVPKNKSLKKVEDQGAFGTDIVSSFELKSANVEGANSYTAIAYNVYVYAPATALGANTYKVTIG
jgi:hypothetical protein